MAEHNATMEATLEALLKEKKYKTLKDVLITMNPSDVAAIFNELDEHALPLLFRLLPKEQAAEAFVEMEPEAQELLIRSLVTGVFKVAESKEQRLRKAISLTKVLRRPSPDS